MNDKYLLILEQNEVDLASKSPIIPKNSNLKKQHLTNHEEYLTKETNLYNQNAE